MAFEFFLALFLMAVGISVAGAGTSFYQLVSGQRANLRFDGETILGMFGHLFMSFVCGPYIMIRMGLAPADDNNTFSVTLLLLAALIAFGWAFITGLLFVGLYLAVTG
ncbi:MAG: hypothetical protein H6873_10630 [Hyphomicrobiaceae bacterium]|nr:hypothetical protein [Hyphomicrobiaceae bacterium]